MTVDAKVLNKILAKIAQHHIKKTQQDVFPGRQAWFNSWKSINIIHHINRSKEKIMFIGPEKLTKFNSHS